MSTNYNRDLSRVNKKHVCLLFLAQFFIYLCYKRARKVDKSFLQKNSSVFKEEIND